MRLPRISSRCHLLMAQRESTFIMLLVSNSFLLLALRHLLLVAMHLFLIAVFFLYNSESCIMSFSLGKYLQHPESTSHLSHEKLKLQICSRTKLVTRSY